MLTNPILFVSISCIRSFVDLYLEVRQEPGDIATLHMQGNHPLESKLGAAARLSIKVILPFAAHQNFAVLGHLEPFGICLCGFDSHLSRL